MNTGDKDNTILAVGELPATLILLLKYALYGIYVCKHELQIEIIYLSGPSYY